METLESLSAALETTGEIESIVRTMKALSAASIRQFEAAEAALTEYERTVTLGLTALLREGGGPGAGVQGAPARGRTAVIVIGSDRGLCGRYNHVAARAAEAELDTADGRLAAMGARVGALLEAAGHPPDRLFPVPGAATGLGAAVQAAIVELDHWTREHGVARVRLVHNRRKGRAQAVPVTRDLLPIPEAELRALAATPWPGRGLPLHRMPSDRLMSWLIRQRLFVALYRALAEALVSEHATRLAAMQMAERNIRERREGLTATYRLHRQEAITAELLDVISGFEAVTGGE